MISYCTEKTTEFSLIPAFSSLLNELGENTPIQYWKTREGNKTSYALHGMESVYLIAFFARRPKVHIGVEGQLQGKINPYIFEFNEIAKKFDIPVFCGMPIAQNLFELSNAENIWFYIPPNAPEYNEVVFNLTNRSDVEVNDPYSVVEQVRHEDITCIIRRHYHPMPWEQAINIMTELNRRPGDGPWFTRGWQHKPVYFIVKQEP
ncbi:hypothetical protein V9657_004528 [Vibrio vulnificus]|jgi:hypothetical protein|nr:MULTISPECIES: hypothetical protein [Vibrio harveyi group]EGR0209292.1 hypothetical protein [Vibrio vulnificus]AQM66582.1 hypothetical protein Vca1114GL_00059 [Vibrio campbellii]EHU9446747.1 hypothetical protein [Vibrio vulnificus]ELB2200577.1 hypothetical protein [Vibrio parahaemolyticus]ELP6741419.1 hypothetical protein [Vibrio vulnificus]